MKKLFVYGTLMRGNSNHFLMRNSKYVANGTIDGYKMYELGSFPGIRPAEESRVRGELYLVPDEDFEDIRSLEGDGYLYIQQEVEVNCPGKGNAKAITFVYNHECKGIYRESTCKGMWRYCP